MNKRKTIFVVDDSITYLTLGNKALSEKYTVHTVNSGARLFKLLEKVKPDLILLDIEMPEMNGYEIMQKIKKDPQTEDIPVIFLTSHDDEDKELHGFSLGAVDYITKPFSAPLLLKRIEVHLLIESQRRDLIDYSLNLKHMAEQRAQEVVKAHEMAQTLLESSPLLIELWDEDMKIIDCNRQTLDTFGLKTKQEYFKRYNEFTPEYQPDGTNSEKKAARNRAQILHRGETLRFEWVRQLPNGDPLPLEITGVRIYRGATALLVYYMHDLRPIKAAIEESNRAKNKFFARMSHELRTPISSVLGISEVELRNPNLPPETEKSFAMINSSATTLLEIINDVFDLSKISSDKMAINNEEYNTASMISTVANIHFAHMGDKDIKVNLYVDEKLPVVLVGDAHRIVQIINNLLSNAFKYTKEGSVDLHVKREPCVKKDCVTLAITVKDTGIGMDKAQLTAINDYTRLHESENAFITGTGLGMPIVYHIAELMGATIYISSEVGEGTTVVIRIPQAFVDGAILGKEAAENLNGLEFDARINRKKFKFTPQAMPYGKVLIVDDVDDNLFVAREIMKPYGLEIETALDGKIAVDRIRAGGSYDIIFMDQLMPGMDGVEATKLIRETGYEKPIIALTANADTGMREFFLENGFDELIPKPIDSRYLDDILKKYITAG